MDEISIDTFNRLMELYVAAYLGDVPKLQQLLEEPELKEKINHTMNSERNHSALFYACYGASNAEAVKVLLAHGANPFQRDSIGHLPLHLAANSWDPEIIKVLLEVENMIDYKLDAATITGQTPLHALFLPGSGIDAETKAKNANPKLCLSLILTADRTQSHAALLKMDKQGVNSLMLVKCFNRATWFAPEAPKAFPIYVSKAPAIANIKSVLEPGFYDSTPFLEAARNSAKARLQM